MDDDDITKKFPILLEGILQDVFSQRAASAWQGAQPQKLTVSMLLPGTSSAAEWRDLLQSRRQFWPTLTTRHASLVPVSAEALQRERRQMQAKHLWYNVDIRWVDLKDKLDVLAPTGLTRDDIWRHLFLTKQRKNPYEEGCYTGEDLEDVKRKWEAKKVYFSQYKNVKTTLERCGPFSLVVLSQRRSQVTSLSGHSDQNASETFSNKLQLNKVQSSLRQTSAKTTQVRSKAKTS